MTFRSLYTLLLHFTHFRSTLHTSAPLYVLPLHLTHFCSILHTSAPPFRSPLRSSRIRSALSTHSARIQLHHSALSLCSRTQTAYTRARTHRGGGCSLMQTRTKNLCGCVWCVCYSLMQSAPILPSHACKTRQWYALAAMRARVCVSERERERERESE
jgi:hypothetical protein